MSVKSHLTFGISVRHENAVTYSVGNEGQMFVAPELRTSQGCSQHYEEGGSNYNL